MSLKTVPHRLNEECRRRRVTTLNLNVGHVHIWWIWTRHDNRTLNKHNDRGAAVYSMPLQIRWRNGLVFACKCNTSHLAGSTGEVFVGSRRLNIIQRCNFTVLVYKLMRLTRESSRAEGAHRRAHLFCTTGKCALARMVPFSPKDRPSMHLKVVAGAVRARGMREEDEYSSPKRNIDAHWI